MRIRHYAAGRVLYRCPDTRTYRLMLTWDGRRWPDHNPEDTQPMTTTTGQTPETATTYAEIRATPTTDLALSDLATELAEVVRALSSPLGAEWRPSFLRCQGIAAEAWLRHVATVTGDNRARGDRAAAEGSGNA